MILTHLLRGLRTRHADPLQAHLRMAVRDRIERGEDPRGSAARRVGGAADVGRTLSPRGALSSALAGLSEMFGRDWESRAG